MNTDKTKLKSNTTESTEENTVVPYSRSREIAPVCGPAITEAINEVNRAFINLCITAGRLGEAEPLAPVLLGVSREILDEIATTGRSGMLLAQAYGLPLVESRFKDPSVLRQIINSGFGSPEAISAVVKNMPLELMSKGYKR